MMHGEGMLCWSDDFGVCRYKALFFIGSSVATHSSHCWLCMAIAMLAYPRAPSSTTSSRVMVFLSGQ